MFKPNAKLPIGAKLLTPPLRAKIGDWVEMTFDACLFYRNIVWYRVKGGFGERSDREDWVADLPSNCVSISDYNWNPGSFESFKKAMDSSLRRGLKHTKLDIEKLQKELDAAKLCENIIEKLTGLFE